MKIKHKKTAIVAVTAIMIFIFYNIFWYYSVWRKYSSYTAGMTELYSNRTYVISNLDGFTYNVKMPDYLRFTGNLGIKAYQGGHCAMIIWPKINGENEYGVFIEDDNGKAKAVELTSDLELPAGVPEDIKKLVERHRTEIDTLYKLASKQWSL